MYDVRLVDSAITKLIADTSNVFDPLGIAFRCLCTRAGARTETAESYTQRVEDIGRICDEFRNRGINQSYVIQGGREVRVLVNSKRVDDLSAARLSSDVASRIEEECVYPGQIKVTVIRDTQTSCVARSR